MKKVSFDKFVELTGLISSSSELAKQVKDKKLFKQLLEDTVTESPMGWSADSTTLNLLKKVCRIYPYLHIASQVDSDSGKKVIYENSIRIVNRNLYYLCVKNQGLEIYSVA